MTAPPLTPELRAQLDKVPVSRDGEMRYAPCQVRLRSGKVLPRVYVVEESRFVAHWGYDPGRASVPLTDVVEIEESPLRLPPAIANTVYEAGESGMGYSLFRLQLSDGRTVPFLMGNAVDFPDWPEGVDPADVVGVEPHAGRSAFQQRGAGPRGAEYFWCLYNDT